VLAALLPREDQRRLVALARRGVDHRRRHRLELHEVAVVALLEDHAAVVVALERAEEGGGRVGAAEADQHELGRLALRRQAGHQPADHARHARPGQPGGGGGDDPREERAPRRRRLRDGRGSPALGGRLRLVVTAAEGQRDGHADQHQRRRRERERRQRPQAAQDLAGHGAKAILGPRWPAPIRAPW
jgi:hypothetical protein